MLLLLLALAAAAPVAPEPEAVLSLLLGALPDVARVHGGDGGGPPVPGGFNATKVGA